MSILIAAAIGLLNGYLVAYVGISSFMMTLAMLTIARGRSVFVSIEPGSGGDVRGQ